MAKQAPYNEVNSKIQSPNYFNYVVGVFIYSVVIFILFKSKLGMVSNEKLKQNYQEYQALKDSTNEELLLEYRNGLDFRVSNYVLKNTNQEKDILLLPSAEYLKKFNKDYNDPLVTPLKLYYFGVNMEMIRFGTLGYEKATFALGLDSNGEIIPVKLDSEEKKQLLFEKFKNNQPLY